MLVYDLDGYEIVTIGICFSNGALGGWSTFLGAWYTFAHALFISHILSTQLFRFVS